MTSTKTFWSRPPRWAYGFLAFLTAFTIFAVHAPAQAISIWDIIRGGARVLQGIQLGSMSPEREMAFGGQIDAQIKQELAANRTPVIRSDHPATLYVNDIGQRMVATLTPEERRTVNFTFQVVNDPGVNAFATMGGFVYINAGLMLMADTEAELAGVIGHEMGHIIEKHAINQMRERAVQQGILSAAGLDQTQVVQLGVDVALNLPNSRGDENESDVVGLSLLRRTGYHPNGMVNFMQKLAQQGGRGMTILSTHPNPGARVENLRQIIAANPPTATETAGMDSRAYCLAMKQVISDRIECKP